MRCPNCETPYSYRNGRYYTNCRCNETDDNDIIDTAIAVETVIEVAEEIIDLFDDE